MATRIKGAVPGKEKAAASSPQTSTGKLKEAVNKTSKPKSTASAPTKPTKPTPKKPTGADVSKQQSKKPASPAPANKPAQPRTKPLDKKPLTPVQKMRVVAAAAVPRSSSLPGKGVASPKPAPGKSVKPVAKDEGKQRVSTSGRNARRSSIGLKKKEAGTSGSATKEQEVTSSTHDKVEDVSMYAVPEPEIQIKNVDCSYPAEAEEKTVQSLSETGKGSIDVVVTEVDQEPLCTAKVGDETEPADPKVVISESYPVLEQQEVPLDIKTQELENKDNPQETSSKQELEHDTSKTNSCNKVEKIAGNSHEEAEKEEVKEVAVAAEKQEGPASAKKDEAAVAAGAAVVSIADESKEIERPAEEKMKEILLPPLQQERKHGKIDSPVSNDVIEEAAIKLRELRKNKVRALAGAFESVISLQEK